jgi:hypothetical protein
MADGNDFGMGYAVGRDNSGGGNGMWGNESWVWILVIFALLGWGGNGAGNGGGLGAYGAGGLAYELGKVATTNDVASGFNNSAVLSNLNDLKLGQTQGFAGVQQTMCQGFNGINTAILQQGNAMERGFAQIAYDNQACCCQTQRAIDGVNYNMAKNTCDLQNTINNSTRDIIDSQNCGTRAILDALTAQRIEAKDAKIAEQDREIFKYQLAASQAAQNNYLIDQVRPCPRPAYITCNPYAASYGFNNNCCCNG